MKLSNLISSEGNISLEGVDMERVLSGFFQSKENKDNNSDLINVFPSKPYVTLDKS